MMIQRRAKTIRRLQAAREDQAHSNVAVSEMHSILAATLRMQRVLQWVPDE